MDGREFVNIPPLGLTGLPLETGRASSGHTGGRLMPSTGQLPPFCTAKYYPSPLGLYSQTGFPHLSRSVYHPYIPMSHLEPTGGVTPLLTRLGQHSMIDSPKDGFCLVGQQSTYPQTSVLKTSANPTQSLHENDPVCHSLKNSKETSKDSKEKVFRSEIFLTSPLQSTAKKDRRFSEDRQSSDLSDRELDFKAEKERKKMTLHRLPKQGEHSSLKSEFTPIRWSGNIERKSKHLQTSLLSNYEGESFSKPIISAENKFIKQSSRPDEAIGPLCQTILNQSILRDSLEIPEKKLSQQCMCSSSHPVNFFCKVTSTTSAPPISSSMYSIIQQAKEPTNEMKTLESNFSATDAASDEHHNRVHIGVQKSNPNGKEWRNSEEKAQFLHFPFSEELLVNETKRLDGNREQESVICCNSSLKVKGLSESFPKNYHVSLDKKIFPSNSDHLHCKQENCIQETCKMSGLIDSQQQDGGIVIVNHPEEKAKRLKISNITNLQMPALATPHSQISTEKEEIIKHGIESKTLGSRKANIQSTDASGHCERSAMQNLISYSGNFDKETAAWQCSGKKSPFGGLGNMKLDETQLKDVKVHNLSQKEVKKDPERPESTKDKAKDLLSFQAEVEVRNPPVGIAVAVARQKDSGVNKMHSSKDV